MRWPWSRLYVVSSFPLIFGMGVMIWSIVVNQPVSQFRGKLNSCFFQNVLWWGAPSKHKFLPIDRLCLHHLNLSCLALAFSISFLAISQPIRLWRARRREIVQYKTVFSGLKLLKMAHSFWMLSSTEKICPFALFSVEIFRRGQFFGSSRLGFRQNISIGYKGLWYSSSC